MIFDNDTGREILEWALLSKNQKRQVFNFIRKSYPEATVREVIKGEYVALKEGDKLVAVGWVMGEAVGIDESHMLREL